MKRGSCCVLIPLLLMSETPIFGCDNHVLVSDSDSQEGSVISDFQLRRSDTNISIAPNRNDRFLQHSNASHECGFESPSAEEMNIDMINTFKWNSQQKHTAQVYTYNIPVYFHVIEPVESPTMVTDQRIQDYMDYLNDAFSAETPFVFGHQGTSRTVNEFWSNNCLDGSVHGALTSSLRVGGKETLNVWLCNKIPQPAGGALIAGFTYLPSRDVGAKDGVMLARTNSADRRRLNTFVHEVGHFLGLLHTFAGGCDAASQGDLVEDTPAHVSNAGTINCNSDPSTWDSCPQIAGLDPVDNYMTYTNNNNCRVRFTAGQSDRMKSQYEMYRFSAPDILSTIPTSMPQMKPTSNMPTHSPTSVPTPAPPTTRTPISPLFLGRPTTSPESDASSLDMTSSPTSPTEPGAAGGDETCTAMFKTCLSSNDCCFGSCRSFLGLGIFPNLCFFFGRSTD